MEELVDSAGSTLMNTPGVGPVPAARLVGRAGRFAIWNQSPACRPRPEHTTVTGLTTPGHTPQHPAHGQPDNAVQWPIAVRVAVSSSGRPWGFRML